MWWATTGIFPYCWWLYGSLGGLAHLTFARFARLPAQEEEEKRGGREDGDEQLWMMNWLRKEKKSSMFSCDSCLINCAPLNPGRFNLLNQKVLVKAGVDGLREAD